MSHIHIYAPQPIERCLAKIPIPRGYEFEVDGVTITVVGAHYPGSKGRIESGSGQVEPDEDASFEATGLYIGGVDVTALLGQWAPDLVTKLEARACGAIAP